MAPERQDERRRIAVLTSGGDYAERILLGLALRGVAVDALLIAQGQSSGRASLFHRIRKSLRERSLAEVLSKGFRKIRISTGTVSKNRGTRSGPTPWEGMAGEIIIAGPLNGPRMLDAMKRIAPDYLVLAGVGIVGKQALLLPRVGTINVHPALLPFARGVGVVARSLQRGVPVGVTAHLVDPGIDTGEILHRELIYVSKWETLESLKRKAAARSVELMVEFVTEASKGARLTTARQPIRFAYCKWPTPDEERQISQQVRGGVAKHLYQRWLEFYGAKVLPDRIEPYPPIQIEPLTSSPQRK